MSAGISNSLSDALQVRTNEASQPQACKCWCCVSASNRVLAHMHWKRSVTQGWIVCLHMIWEILEFKKTDGRDGRKASAGIPGPKSLHVVCNKGNTTKKIGLSLNNIFKQRLGTP